MTCWSSLRLEGYFSATLAFIKFHRFSIGLRSGLLPGQSSTCTFSCSRNSLTALLRWHGAPSCINIEQLCTDMWSCSLLLSNATYLVPVIVVLGGRKLKLAVPMADIAPHTIKLGGCLTVGVVYFSSYLFPAGFHTLYFRTQNCFIEDSSEKSTFFHISTVQWACALAKLRRFFFMPSVRRGFRAGLCDFSPNSVNSRRWTVLVLTLHPLSCS